MTVNDFYLLLTTKVIFFFPLLSEGIVFVICAGDELTKVRLCLVLFHLSQPNWVPAWRFGSICIEQRCREYFGHHFGSETASGTKGNRHRSEAFKLLFCEVWRAGSCALSYIVSLFPVIPDVLNNDNNT